jgi:hypothetical protein
LSRAHLANVAGPETHQAHEAHDTPPLRRLRWAQACRIVPTRYPAVNLFDRVADAADFEALYALEALTNERARQDLGEIERVPADQRLYGPGSGPIMSAFTHVNTLGSRFSDGAYGVFYAAHERATAVAETRYHHARFMAATQERPQHLPMRLYHVAIAASLHDLRGPGSVPEAVYAEQDYSAAQALGRRLHGQGSAGVVYRSVRHAGGHCVGLFKPTGASACLHAAYLLYAWDGRQFSDVYEKTE